MAARSHELRRIGARFHETCPGDQVVATADRDVDAEAIGAILLDACRAGAEAWPGLELDALDFAAFAGARTLADQPAREGLLSMRLGELYLACGCVSGAPAAIEHFERTFIERVPRYLARLRPSERLVDEVRQALRTRLFVAEPGRAPKIGQYTGRGSLEGWVRVAALRTALNLSSAERGRATSDEDLEELVLENAAPAGGYEAEYLKAHYREDVAAVFKAALAGLDERSRLLLRLHYVEGVHPSAIAKLYDVHRTTVLRWLESAEADLLAAVRAGLSQRLNLSPTECDSLLKLVESRLDVSLSPLLDAE